MNVVVLFMAGKLIDQNFSTDRRLRAHTAKAVNMKSEETPLRKCNKELVNIIFGDFFSN